MQSNKLKVLAAAVALALPLAAQAESTLTAGSGSPLNAAANVDFRVIIPKFVYLRVGTGSALATGGAIDEIQFAPTVAQVGTGAISGSGGNVTGSTVTVEVRGNNGPITLGATGPAALTNGLGDSIPWTEIVATATGSAPSHPAVGGATVSVGVGKVVAAVGTWAYQYANSATPPFGEYTGRVTYTAAMP